MGGRAGAVPQSDSCLVRVPLSLGRLRRPTHAPMCMWVVVGLVCACKSVCETTIERDMKMRVCTRLCVRETDICLCLCVYESDSEIARYGCACVYMCVRKCLIETEVRIYACDEMYACVHVRVRACL
jgi:hypothetical protein